MMFFFSSLTTFMVLFGVYLIVTSRKKRLEHVIVGQREAVNKGMPTQSLQYVLRVLATAGLFFTAGWFLVGGIAWGVVFLVFGLCVPVLTRGHRKKKRIRRIEQQLETVLYQGTNVLRGGGGIYQLLEFLASDKTPEPLRTNFQEAERVVKDLGTPPIEALQKMAADTGLADVGMMTTALAEAQKNGSDLAEVVEMFAADLRNRRMLQNEMAAKTTQGIMTANFLLAIGIGVPGLLKMFSLITDNPTLAGGTSLAIQILTAVCYIMMGFGYLWIRRMAQI